jgi:hypothetical protein
MEPQNKTTDITVFPDSRDGTMSGEHHADRARKGGKAMRTLYGGGYFRHLSRLQWVKTKK